MTKWRSLNCNFECSQPHFFHESKKFFKTHNLTLFVLERIVLWIAHLTVLLLRVILRLCLSLKCNNFFLFFRDFFKENQKKYLIPFKLLEEGLFCVALYQKEYHRCVIVNMLPEKKGFIRVCCYLKKK